MMLSRVADHLYWMARYLERAEHTARLLDVTLDLMPERDPLSNRRAWERLFRSLQLPIPDALRGTGQTDPYGLTQMLTFDADRGGAILAHIANARSNARQVREQISSEMWEQVNRLYLDVSRGGFKRGWRDQPHAFFQMIKQGTHLFTGITDSTMNHGEGWHYIQAGYFIERAENTAALLRFHLGDTPAAGIVASSTEEYLNWVGLLRACTAFEAFCKVYSAEIRIDQIVEFLLLADEFPHSVHFAVKKVREALLALAVATDTQKNNQVLRRVGRLTAMLDYDVIDEILSGDLSAYLLTIQQTCGHIHTRLYQTYIDYSAEEKLPTIDW